MMDQSRTATLFLISFTALLILAGCSGSDGAQGPVGPRGPDGQAGPPGPGGSGAVPVASADKINIRVTSVTVPAGGGAPVVELTLTNDLNQGLEGIPPEDVRFVLAQLSPAPAGSGASSEWQNYITRSSNGIPNAQGSTEAGDVGTFVDNGDGTYQYTFAEALTDYAGGPTFDAAKTHRLGIEIRDQAPNSSNGIYDFVPAGGAPTFTRLIVDNDTCDACHDRLEFHGGPRTDVTFCVTCHNPSSIDGDTGNTVDFKRLIHNIHSGRIGFQIIGFGGSVHDWSDVEWPQDIRNCQTCHEESDADTPQASNYRLVPNRAACGTCHYDDGVAGSDNEYAIEDGVHPGGFLFTDDTQCVDCHGPNGTVVSSKTGRLVQIPIAHEILEDTAALAFEYEVVSITNTGPGQTPTASIRVLDPTDPAYATNPAGTAYDINDPAGPFQGGGASLRLDIAWTTADYGNIDPNDDLGRSPTSGQPFAPISVDFKSGATNDGNNVFTKTASDAIPTGITGSGVALIEGRPEVIIDGTPTRLAVTSSGIDFAITDASPRARRDIVDISKCNDCHKNLSMHGNNRTGNTELCTTCHNPNATDINRRVAGSECDMELGLDDQPIDLKRMIHAMHSGNVGMCGYGNSAHPFFDLRFPGHLNNCEGCHLTNTFYPVDPTKVLGTTFDVGADRSDLTDDVVVSPNTSVCSACHTSALAAEHMEQNGGDFSAGKSATGALISASVETCQLCHGPGRVADVRVMHGVDEFEFN